MQTFIRYYVCKMYTHIIFLLIFRNQRCIYFPGISFYFYSNNALRKKIINRQHYFDSLTVRLQTYFSYTSLYRLEKRRKKKEKNGWIMGEKKTINKLEILLFLLFNSRL